MSSPALSRYSEDGSSVGEKGSSAMTWLQAAEQVLRDEGPDMHIRDLTARIMELGIVKSNCATSLETLLYRQTSSTNINSKFVRVVGKHGWFGLREDYFELPGVKSILEMESDAPPEDVETEKEIKPARPSVGSMLESLYSYDNEIEPQVFHTRKRKRSYFSSEDSSSSDGMVHKREESSSDEESVTDIAAYRKKYYFVKRLAESMIYENASLADQLSRVNDKITRAVAEKKFLLDKLVGFERIAQRTKISSVGRSSPKPDIVPKQTNKVTKKKPVTRKQPAKPVPQRKPEVRSEVKNFRSGGTRKLVMSDSSPSSESDDYEESAPVTKKQVKPKSSKAPSAGSKLELAMRCGKVRRLHPISLHEDGSPVFPIVIGGLRVHNLGQIVHDRPAYHSERYLLPVGFESSRTYPSMMDPSRKTVYTCRILDGGDTPLFEMVADDDHGNPVRAASSTACQTIVLRNINKARDKQATNSGSGPEFFGYSNPTILDLLQKIPESRKCFKYKFVRFAMPQRRAKKPQASSAKPGPTKVSGAKEMSDVQKVKMKHNSSLAIAPVFGGIDMISYSSSDEASISSDGDLVIDNN